MVTTPIATGEFHPLYLFPSSLSSGQKVMGKPTFYITVAKENKYKTGSEGKSQYNRQ